MIGIQLYQDPKLLAQNERIIEQLTRIGDGIMALKDELTALAAAFDTATNGVAAELAKLRQQIADLLANPNSITDADKAAVEATFQAQIDKLTAMGQDPNNPVPTPQQA